MPHILALMEPYRAVFERYLFATDEAGREAALIAAGDIGRQALLDWPETDRMIQLHHVAQSTLAAAWHGLDPATPRARAREALARGDGTALLMALIEPHQTAQLAHHERRWRREHNTLAAMFDQTGDLIVILDEEGQIDDVNVAFLKATGWSKRDAVAGPHSAWRTPLPMTGTQQHRADQVRQDGSTFTVDWSISPVFGRDGQLLSHVCIGRDVTQQRQIEDSLRENDKLRAIATLAGGIAHDFNNLLGSILGLAELCTLEAADGSRQARNLGRIREAAGKAAVLVRQMLDFSRQTPKTVRRVSISELLDHAAGLMRPGLPTNVSLAVQVDDDTAVCIDPIQMEQVLLNIAGNAAYAMREHGGVIRIVADRANPTSVPRGHAVSHARLRIIDGGEGMSAEVLSKIFNPFFTTKPVGEGTGLGLAAVHGIVTSHEGVVEVASELGVGSTFSVFLPTVEAGPQAAAQTGESAQV